MLNTIKKKRPATNKRLLKLKILMELEAMQIYNPGMKSDIDSYNYGIHDAAEKIKKLL